MSENKHETTWNQNFKLIETFSSVNKRWPSTMSKEISEKKLAQWWSRQKYLLNIVVQPGEKSKENMSEERKTLVRDLITLNSSFERDGIWDTRYEVVSTKFKVDGKLWVQSQANPDELKVLRWWNQQKTFAKKFQTNPQSCGGMTQERFDKVEALTRLLKPSAKNKTKIEETVIADTQEVQ